MEKNKRVTKSRDRVYMKDAVGKSKEKEKEQKKETKKKTAR